MVAGITTALGDLVFQKMSPGRRWSQEPLGLQIWETRVI
jgi:hypothetical protein